MKMHNVVWLLGMVTAALALCWMNEDDWLHVDRSVALGLIVYLFGFFVYHLVRNDALVNEMMDKQLELIRLQGEQIRVLNSHVEEIEKLLEEDEESFT